MERGFVFLDEVLDKVRWDAKYATWDNFTGTPVDGYEVNRIVGSRAMAEALLDAQTQAAALGFGLLLWDGYRPQRAVNRFLAWSEQPEDGRTKQRFYPKIDRAAMFTHGYVARRSGHSRGSAVDLTLYRLDNGELAPMGGGHDLMDECSHHGARGVSGIDAQNRRTLCCIMEHSGFERYDREWWHYALKDEPYPDIYFDFPILSAATMRFRSSEAAAATGGRLHGPDVWIEGASFDSRSFRPGSLFVPIIAARDGHDHIADAFSTGAAASLTSRPVGSLGIPPRSTMIEIDDTAAALMALGGWARSRRPDTVVGITGSVGKTSTKDLLAAALATTLRTAASPRSFNNEQGLPITILDSPDDTEAMVLEMGMRGLGEIARLCAVARPSVGVVTVVGAAHTRLLGGIEGVARAKGELIEALEPTGVAVLNADDARVRKMASRTSARILTYGAALDADVHVDAVRLDDLARPRFTVHTPWGTTDTELAVSGAHMALNAAAAIAAAGTLGVPVDVAAAALATATVSEGRMQVLSAPGGAVVVNDAYNANPTSMVAALDALAAMPARRRVAVLGLMAEIEDPPAGHRLVAAHAAGLGIEVVAVAVDLYGVTPVEDPIRALGPLGPGDVVLVKGSLVAGLQLVAQRLAAGAEV